MVEHRSAVLLCRRNTLGTAYGGDGVILNPDAPYWYELATWERDEWRLNGADGYGGYETLDADEPDFYAEITHPF
ncbi:hypothetical protein Sbs19_29560 [Sphingobium sp. BS19]|nr:hypothetical protein Sbs19_29560 [Sphingobium sp. BS19]